VWWEEREAKGEVGAGEDGKGLDEDVCDGLIAREVRVELVPIVPWSAGRHANLDVIGRWYARLSDRANK
jgi:hypothetical protein